MDNRLLAIRSNFGLDIAVAVLGFVFALMLLPLRLLSSQVYIETIPLMLGVACGSYYLWHRNHRNTYPLELLSGSFLRVSVILVVLGLSGLVVLARIGGGRTLPFYLLGVAIGSLILLQVLLLEDSHLSPTVLLAEVLGLAFVVRFGALAFTPGYIGIDIWSHTTYVEQILAAGSLDPIADNKYYAAPLYHLVTVATVVALDVPVENALYLSIGVVVPTSVLFVFATANYLVPIRWALAATTLYALADHVVRWGVHLIPTSLGLVFFLAVVFFVVKIRRDGVTAPSSILLAVFSAGIVFTHQISTFILLVFMGSVVATGFVFETLDVPHGPFADESETLRTLTGLFAFDVGLTALMWSVTPFKDESFFEVTISWFAETVATAGFLNLAGSSGPSGGTAANTGVLGSVVPYLEVLGFLVILGLTIIGSLTALRRSFLSKTTVSLVLAAAVMVFLTLGLPFFGIRNLVPGRWFAFMYVPMVIVGALGLHHLSRAVPRGAFAAVVIVVAFSYPGAMVATKSAAPDNPVFDSRHERLSYTEPELAAYRTLSDHTVASREVVPLHTDKPYMSLFDQSETYPARVIEVQGNGEVVRHQFVVYRTAQTNEYVYFSRGKATVPHVATRPDVCKPNMNQIYENGQVLACSSGSMT